jgi:hypothetical protein
VHPLLLERRSLAAYLACWGGLAVVPFSLVHSEAPLAALALSLLVTVAFALFTLPTWYLCRALPLTRAQGFRIASSHAVAALVWSSAFVLGLRLGAEVLSLREAWGGVPREFEHAEAALFGVGALFYLLVAAFHYVLVGLEVRREASEREGALALSAHRAELAALRAQVHPHFLFNSLNTVSALVGYDPQKAREACLLLAEYLRGTLRAQDEAVVPLAREWELSERYLKVEALRLGDRLRTELSLDDDALACLVPPLLLQPLVENAVTHGVAPVENPLPVRIVARRNGARLAIELENGVDPAPRRREGGVGLANVRARLAAEYAGDASLRIERDARHFRAVLDLPVRVANASEAP